MINIFKALGVNIQNERKTETNTESIIEIAQIPVYRQTILLRSGKQTYGRTKKKNKR